MEKNILEGNFRCKGFDCIMTFTRSEHLARHMRKHTGVKPFVCHCGRAFSRLDNVRQHNSTTHPEQPEENAENIKELTILHHSLSIEIAAHQIEQGMFVGEKKPASRRKGRRITSSSSSSGRRSGSRTRTTRIKIEPVDFEDNWRRDSRSNSSNELDYYGGGNDINQVDSDENDEDYTSTSPHPNSSRLHLISQDDNHRMHLLRHSNYSTTSSSITPDLYDSSRNEVIRAQNLQHPNYYSPYRVTSPTESNVSNNGGVVQTTTQLFSSEPLKVNRNRSTSLPIRHLQQKQQQQQYAFSNSIHYEENNEDEQFHSNSRPNSLPNSSSIISTSRSPYEEHQHHSYLQHQQHSKSSTIHPHSYSIPSSTTTSNSNQFQHYQQQQQMNPTSYHHLASSNHNHSPTLSPHREGSTSGNSVTLPPISEILPLRTGSRGGEESESVNGAGGGGGGGGGVYYSQLNHSNQTSPSTLSISLSDGRSSITSLGTLSSTSSHPNAKEFYPLHSSYGGTYTVGLGIPHHSQSHVNGRGGGGENDYNSTTNRRGGGGGGSYLNLASYELPDNQSLAGAYTEIRREELVGVDRGDDEEDSGLSKSTIYSSKQAQHRQQHHHQQQQQQQQQQEEALYQDSPFSVGPLILHAALYDKSHSQHLSQPQSQSQSHQQQHHQQLHHQHPQSQSWAPPAPPAPAPHLSSTSNGNGMTNHHQGNSDSLHSLYEELRSSSSNSNSNSNSNPRISHSHSHQHIPQSQSTTSTFIEFVPNQHHQNNLRFNPHLHSNTHLNSNRISGRKRSRNDLGVVTGLNPGDFGNFETNSGAPGSGSTEGLGLVENRETPSGRSWKRVLTATES